MDGPYSDNNIITQKLRLIAALGLLLLSGICPGKVNAQNKIIDSLVKLLPATKADTNRVILLNKIGMALYSTDYQKALNYSNQANSLATKLNYTRGLVVNLHNQSLIYTFKDDYSTALIKERQAASLALKINDYLLLAKAYSGVGIIYSRLNDSVRSMAAFDEAIKALARTSDKSYNAAILHNVAVLYIGMKQFDRGLKDLFTAAELNEQHKNNQWLVQNYYWIGRVYYMQKDYQQALKYEGMAITIGYQYHFYQPLVKALGIQGATNLALKQYPLAEAQLLQAENIAEDNKIASEQTAILKSLADLYEQKNDLKNAVLYQKKYHTSYEAVFNSEKAKLVAENQARFEDKQKYIENELLKKDGAITEAHIKQRNLQLMISLLISLVVIISAVFVYLAYYKIKQKNIETQFKNQQIEAQNIELEILSQLKNKLFSVLAHDLRGPMATLKNLLQMYELDVIDKEEEDMIRKSIMQKVDQNSELINNLLIWGRSQLNGFVVSPGRLVVHELVEHNIQQLKADIDSKGIFVTNTIGTDIMAIADYEMIDAVVRNLLSNAIKFTPENGAIALSATVTHTQVQVTIADSGIGITPAQAVQLFKGDFYTTKTMLNPHGTGLGLQICKEFIEQNGGKIWVTSKPGEGASFIFTLPVG